MKRKSAGPEQHTAAAPLAGNAAASGSPGNAFDLPALAELLPRTLPFDAAEFDFNAIPSGAGVFLLETGGEPFIGKSTSLRARLTRLLAAREPKPAPAAASRETAPGAQRGRRPRLNLRGATTAIHYRSTGSAFETSLLLYRVTRAVYPSRYRDLLRLRVPPLVKLSLDNPYPRCSVTRRLGRRGPLWFGPFPNRAAAEKYSTAVLDLFLVRRCIEAIHPDPAHPGCIYGEMSMCLRPCQAKCSSEEYAAEAARLAAFLASAGASLVRELESQRDRVADELQFEEAARIHKRLEKVRDAMKQGAELACDLEHFHGLVVQQAATSPGGRSGDAARAVELFPVWRGFLLPQITFTFEVVEGKPVSMDARLRELLAAIDFRGGPPRVRGEHLALLARWFYRGTRKGEFVPFDSYEKLPFRKIVNAISRVSHGSTPPDPPAPQS